MTSTEKKPSDKPDERWIKWFCLALVLVPTIFTGMFISLTSHDFQTGLRVSVDLLGIAVLGVLVMSVIKPYSQLPTSVKEKISELFGEVLARTILAAVPAAIILYMLLSWSHITATVKLICIAVAIVSLIFVVNGLWSNHDKQ